MRGEPPPQIKLEGEGGGKRGGEHVCLSNQYNENWLKWLCWQTTTGPREEQSSIHFMSLLSAYKHFTRNFPSQIRQLPHKSPGVLKARLRKN